MNIRKNYLTKAETCLDVGTKVIDIKGTKPISAIELQFKITNGATSNTSLKLSDAIPSIALVDQGNVICSGSLLSHQITMVGVLKLPPVIIHKEGASGIQQESVIIPFGRYIGDPDYHLSVANFSNLQLKITSSATISATVGFATGTLTVDVILHTIEQGANVSKGYVITKDIVDFTPAASGDKVVDMPLDYPFLDLVMVSRETLVATIAKMTNSKLTFDNDSYIFVDEVIEDTLNRNKMRLPRVYQNVDALRNNTGVYLNECWDDLNISMIGTTIANIATPTSIAGEGITLALLEYSTPATPTLNTSAVSIMMGISGHAFGSSIHHTFDSSETSIGLDVSGFKKGTLKITEGNAGGVGLVRLSQMKMR